MLPVPAEVAGWIVSVPLFEPFRIKLPELKLWAAVQVFGWARLRSIVLAVGLPPRVTVDAGEDNALPVPVAVIVQVCSEPGVHTKLAPAPEVIATVCAGPLPAPPPYPMNCAFEIVPRLESAAPGARKFVAIVPPDPVSTSAFAVDVVTTGNPPDSELFETHCGTKAVLTDAGPDMPPVPVAPIVQTWPAQLKLAPAPD